MKKSLKWTPTVPVRRADNLLSSVARTRGDFGFKPSYSNEKRENMNFIMTNEYMRKWFNERDYHQRELFIKLQTQMEEKHIRRRYVQRMLTREKKEKVMPIIQLRRFQNIGPKSDTRRDSENSKQEEKEKKEDETQKTKTKDEKQQENNELKKTQVKKESDHTPYQRYKPDCNVPPTIKRRSRADSNQSKLEALTKPSPAVANDSNSSGKNGLNDEKTGKNGDQENERKINVMVMKPCYCTCVCYRNGLEDE